MNNPIPTSDYVLSSSLVPDTCAVPVYSNNVSQLAEAENVSLQTPWKRAKVMTKTPKLTIADLSSVAWVELVVGTYEIDFKNDNPLLKANMVTKICGHDVKDISASIFWKLCASFKVSSLWNAKNLKLEILAQYKINEDAYWALHEVDGGSFDNENDLYEIQTLETPRQQPHSIFRPLNVLFNDKIKGSLIGLRGTRFREESDGSVFPGTIFWTKVEKAFVSGFEEEISQLQFMHEMYKQYTFDRYVIIRYDWKSWNWCMQICGWSSRFRTPTLNNPVKMIATFRTFEMVNSIFSLYIKSS